MLGISIGALNTSVSFRNETEENAYVQLSDTSRRVCPSIFSYTEKYRTMGDIAETGLKRNILTSFQYLNRLIGIDNNTNFGEKELNKYYFIGDDLNNNNINIKYQGKNIELEFKNVIVGFLNYIKKIYLFDKNIKEKISVFSYPDYYNVSQINLYRDILKAVDFKDIYLINESTAITLYYGYSKYHDLFMTNKNLNSNITKYIIFIDIGHSKTSFILSKFNCSVFTVLKVHLIPFLGARDFDFRIYDYCYMEFQKKNKDVSIKGKGIIEKKFKLKLISEIMKSRKKLTVNEESMINVDSLIDNIDFSLQLTRDKYEELTKKEFDKFKIELKNFYNDCQNILNGEEINSIEMAGDFLRTPKFETIIKEITNKNLSKSIIVDECVSLGCVYYGALIMGKIKFKKLKGVIGLNNYPIYYSINNSENKHILFNKENIPSLKNIGIEIINKTNVLHLYTKKEENGSIIPLFDIIVKSPQEDISKIFLELLIDYNGFVSILRINALYYNNIVTINDEKSVIEIKYFDTFYFSNNEKSKNNINEMKSIESIWNEDDRKYLTYLSQKNLIQKDLINLKYLINDLKLSDKRVNDQNINDYIKIIEKNLNKENKEASLDYLEMFKTQVDDLIELISEDNVIQNKNKFLKDIQNDIEKCTQLQIQNQGEKATQLINLIDQMKPKIKFMVKNNDLLKLMKEYKTKRDNFLK